MLNGFLLPFYHSASFVIVGLSPIKMFKNLVTCEHISSGSFMLMFLKLCWCVRLILAITIQLVYNNISLEGIVYLRQEPPL